MARGLQEEQLHSLGSGLASHLTLRDSGFSPGSASPLAKGSRGQRGGLLQGQDHMAGL